jgi:hypothetical protein
MAKPRRRENDSLRRRGPRREPLPRVLVVCEGEVTEREYVEYLRRTERIPINLTIRAGGTTKTLVETAVRLQKEAKTSRDPNDHFDQVWCVFDVDQHPKIDDAKQQANAHGIHLVISNPCFDLWILLHFEDLRKHTHRHKVQSACRKHIKDYDKSPPCEQLFERFPEAERRATELNNWHASCGTDGQNPSTNAHDFVAKIRSYRRPY